MPMGLRIVSRSTWSTHLTNAIRYKIIILQSHGRDTAAAVVWLWRVLLSFRTLERAKMYLSNRKHVYIPCINICILCTAYVKCYYVRLARVCDYTTVLTTYILSCHYANYNNFAFTTKTFK